MLKSFKQLLKQQPFVAQLLLVVFLLISALLPFHALLSTWAISNFGHQLLFKSWKEILILVISFPLAALVVIQRPELMKTLWQRRINQIILAFFVITLGLGLLHHTGLKSEVAGLVFDLRFLAFFVYAQLLALLFDQAQLTRLAHLIILLGGLVVSLFGLLQVTVLPSDFLRHFGYGPAIIQPFYTIDNNPHLVRIISTLRGANELGAYLVLWLPLLMLATKRHWSRSVWFKLGLSISWVASLVTLYASGSRSAWLGSLVALAITTLLLVGRQWRNRLILAGGALGILAAIVLSISWHSGLVQSALLHRDPNRTTHITSDTQHQNSLQMAFTSVVHHPLGLGPGTVNLASSYGPHPLVVENYYLQIGEELGWAGLACFLLIIGCAARRLWQTRQTELQAALLGGFVGLALVNLLLPAWNDETVSLLYWGLLGLILFGVGSRAKKYHVTI